MRRRIAFLDYFPPHYRQRLYEEIGRRMDADFIFFSDERERWHNDKMALAYEGDYRRVEMRTVRVAGQSIVPGIVRALGRYDAVIKSPNGKLMLPLTYAAGKARRVPFVLWTGMWHHPTTRVHRLSRPLMERIYRGSSAIVTYGEHVERFVAETPGVDPEKIFVAGQAVDRARFDGVKPDRASEELLFVGQFKPYKGVATLLDAFSRTTGAGARLRVVGNGPLEAQIAAAAERDPRIELVGHVAQEHLATELARARALVLPSETTALDREPWGLVVNEAMHAGLAVVASDAVGAAAGGLVRDGSNGLVVPEGRPDALGDALSRILGEEGLAERLGEQARIDAAEFSYERMASAFESAVEYAIAARGR